MDAGDWILFAAGVTSLLTFVAVYLYQVRENRGRLSRFESIWAHARELVAAELPGAAPIPSVLTGRPSLAYHVEVVTKETVNHGEHDEIITRRVHEESGGAFATAEETVHFSHAALTTEADADFGGFVVYSSATSMFAGRQQIPPPVYAFLAQRSLPLPRQDQMFAAGFKVVIRERVVVPGTPLWIAPAEDSLLFDLGTLAEARRHALVKQTSPLWGALISAVLVGAVAGLAGSILSQFVG